MSCYPATRPSFTAIAVPSVLRFVIHFFRTPPSFPTSHATCNKQCLGIELVQGLVEAAAHHLRTAETFLSEPRPTLPGTASALSNTDNSPLSTKATAEETGASPLGAHRDGSHHRRGGGNKSGGGGRGGDGRNGKASSGKAASSRGLSAADLEELIADLLSRQPLEVTGAGTGGDCNDEGTARGGREATAEEVASWVVRELGHRR